MAFASTPSPEHRNTSQGAKRVNRPRQPHTDLAAPDEEPTNPRPTPASEGVGSGDADPHPEWRQDVAEASPHNPKEGTDGRQRPALVEGAQIRAPSTCPWRKAVTAGGHRGCRKVRRQRPKPEAEQQTTTSPTWSPWRRRPRRQGPPGQEGTDPRLGEVDPANGGRMPAHGGRTQRKTTT